MKIAVIGDIIIDRYLNGTCERISPEAPTPIMLLQNETYSLGGAANLAKNLTTLGAEVMLFTVFGNNDYHNIIYDRLDKIKLVQVEEDRKFTVKTRLIANNQQLLRYDNEDVFEISKDSVEFLRKAFQYECEENQFDAVIISDYNKGVISDNLLKEIYNICQLLHIKVFTDPKQSLEKCRNNFLITPNLKEASLLFKKKMLSKDDVINNISNIQLLMNMYGILNTVITLGDSGAYLITTTTSYHFETNKISVYDVTGAGDTFLAALVFDYLRNKDLHLAISFANLAASLSVQKRGTATVTLSEIQQSVSKIFDTPSLKEHLDYLKSINCKIVFTNGVYDVLHVGHLHLLKTAKSYGDYLIVAINSDNSVKRLKGDSRPIFNEEQRALMLSSLKDVDAVVVFSEDTPFEILQILKPDVLVKGADYKLENVIGKEFVKETILVELKPEQSTSNVIQQIQNAK